MLSRKFVEMLKWFYLVYLNYNSLDEIPPMIGVMKIDLLALLKQVDSLGGYVAVTLSNKWGVIAQMHGLTTKDGEAIKDCFTKFIDMVLVYRDTAQVSWTEKALEKKGDSSMNAEEINPDSFESTHEGTVRDGYTEQHENRIGVGNASTDEEGSSNASSNDFDVIV